MIICALCNQEKEAKSNTHFLSDSIIRTCLNAGGKNIRESGLYTSMNNDTPFVTVNFQRRTPTQKLVEVFGRNVTDEEIAKSKQKIEFSVNDKFCKDCESKFTVIEKSFTDNLLPLFRQGNLNKIDILEIDEIRIFRLFFLLQIWRTHVCEQNFQLTRGIAEKLRTIILNYEKVSIEDILDFPLSITYLETLGGEKFYTENLVGYAVGINPNVIFMNDYIIQFYEKGKINFYSCYGINDENDYAQFVNQNENKFKVKIIHDAERKNFLLSYRESKVKKTGDYLIKEFVKQYQAINNRLPELYYIPLFAEYIKEKKFLADDYTEKKITDNIIGFILYYLPKVT